MSVAQRLLQRLAPGFAARAEAGTREWTATCPNGHVHDLWDLGGIRYRARGTKKARMLCPTCGMARNMTIARAA